MMSWKNEHQHNNHWWTFRLYKLTVLNHLPWWEWLFCPHCTKMKYRQTSCSEQIKTRSVMHFNNTWRHQPPTSLVLALIFFFNEGNIFHYNTLHIQGVQRSLENFGNKLITDNLKTSNKVDWTSTTEMTWNICSVSHRRLVGVLQHEFCNCVKYKWFVFV